MKTKKLLTSAFVTAFFSIMYFNSFAQLNGYYTIGGATSDYNSIYEATSELYSHGIDGDVTFALNPGTYPGHTFNEIPGASSNSKFTMQSATLDSTDVIFEGTIGFYETEYIEIKAVTISSNFNRAIEFYRSKGISLKNCAISTNYNSNSTDAPVRIRHNWNSGFSDFTIKYSTINSPEMSIYCSGENGATNISNCVINSGEGLSFKASWASKINLQYNIFNGGVEIDTYEESHFIGNYVNGEVDMGLMDSVIDNIFHSDEEYRISSYLFKGNHFHEQSFRFASYSTSLTIRFFDNYFEGSVHLSFATDIIMQLNNFLDGVSMSFNKKLLFTNNKVYGGLSYGEVSSSNNYYRIYNNIFFNDIVLARGHNSIISYNNFLNDAILHVEYSDIKVFDNNFSTGIVGGFSPENIDHNNYYPLQYVFYDQNSLHYDPMYDENEPGIAKNPLLQGKGWAQAPLTDFDGLPRKNPPALGANEIFICSDSMNNHIKVPCGEELFLNVCNTSNTDDFWWTPDTCIQNSNTAYTMITACENTTWYLYNTTSGLIDSVIIETQPFQVEIAETPLIYCGYGRTLNASYHPNASYHWTPEFGLDDPFIRNPILNPIDTVNLQYILKCQIEGCGVSHDTMVAEYDPLPNVAMYFPQQSIDTAFFSNASRCADEYLWDFGDGSTSTEENPIHIYQEPGFYTIMLTGSNEYGSRIASASLPFFWVGVNEELAEAKIKVYPNPVDKKLFIEGIPHTNGTSLRIVHLSGKILIEEKVFANETSIDTANLAEGIYFVQIIKGTKFYNKKIVVIH